MSETVEIIEAQKKNLSIPIRNLKSVDTKKYLDAEYINYVLNHKIKKLRDRIFIKFLFMTGVRISEAVSVKKQDIYFEDDIIKIKWLKNKRKKEERTIPLHKDLREILLIYTSPMNKQDKLFDFSDTRGYQITQKYLGTNPHTLRHSFAVHFLKNGGRITDLKELLGHSNLNTTMEYASISQRDLKKEVDKIEF